MELTSYILQNFSGTKTGRFLTWLLSCSINMLPNQTKTQDCEDWRLETGEGRVKSCNVQLVSPSGWIRKFQRKSKCRQHFKCETWNRRVRLSGISIVAALKVVMLFMRSKQTEAGESREAG